MHESGSKKDFNWCLGIWLAANMLDGLCYFYLIKSGFPTSGEANPILRTLTENYGLESAIFFKIAVVSAAALTSLVLNRMNDRVSIWTFRFLNTMITAGAVSGAINISHLN